MSVGGGVQQGGTAEATLPEFTVEAERAFDDDFWRNFELLNSTAEPDNFESQVDDFVADYTTLDAAEASAAPLLIPDAIPVLKPPPPLVNVPEVLLKEVVVQAPKATVGEAIVSLASKFGGAVVGMLWPSSIGDEPDFRYTGDALPTPAPTPAPTYVGQPLDSLLTTPTILPEHVVTAPRVTSPPQDISRWNAPNDFALTQPEYFPEELPMTTTYPDQMPSLSPVSTPSISPRPQSSPRPSSEAWPLENPLPQTFAAPSLPYSVPTSSPYTPSDFFIEDFPKPSKKPAPLRSPESSPGRGFIDDPTLDFDVDAVPEPSLNPQEDKCKKQAEKPRSKCYVALVKQRRNPKDDRPTNWREIKCR